MDFNSTMKWSAVLGRFFKAFTAGAVVAMAGVPLVQPVVWSEFGVLLQALAMAGCFGGLVGVLMGAQKWASWKDDSFL